MLVKDLIYLLQTRGKPDDEVWINAMVKTKNGRFVEANCQLGDEFFTVHSLTKKSICNIYIDEFHFDQFRKQIKEAEEHEYPRNIKDDENPAESALENEIKRE